MIEQRQFHRVKLTERCDLAYQNTNYQGELENISLNGAVISFAENLSIPMGSICLLTVYLKGEASPLRLNAEVIHSNLASLGMRFVPLDEYGQNCLVHLVESFTTEPEMLVTELARIKWHIANYLRAS
jgi:c-di-GMP-binding flagellar brake protein YcgR